MENRPSLESLKSKVSSETLLSRGENLEFKTNKESFGSESVNKAAQKITQNYPPEKISEIFNDKPPLTTEETDKIVLELSPEKHDKQMEELLGVLLEKGLKNTLKVIQKIGNPHLEDDFHRILVQYFSFAGKIDGLESDNQLFRSINMKLYEVTMPETRASSDKEKDFKKSGRSHGAVLRRNAFYF